MDGTKPYKSIGFGAMDVPKPYKFIGFGTMDVTKPYKFMGFGNIRLYPKLVTGHAGPAPPGESASGRRGRPDPKKLTISGLVTANNMK
jgi:hypothetical protein